MDVDDDIPNLRLRRKLELEGEDGAGAPRKLPPRLHAPSERPASPPAQRKHVKPSAKSASLFAATDGGLFEFGMMALGLDYASGTGPYSAKKATKDGTCKILCVGVGGGGGNTINRLVRGMDSDAPLAFMALNTDQQALDASLADETLVLGAHASRGLGAGGVPSVGRACAEEAAREISAAVEGVDMVFITAGMGGGTGSGAAPVVAEIARQHDCLTVGVVTKPFAFEGKKRMQQALEAIEKLEASVDILIVVDNNRLLEIVPDNYPLDDAFQLADEILRQGIIGISDIIVKPGLINVDFADVRSIMSHAGKALLGIGRGSGRHRAHDAAVAAVSSPLLDFPLEKARSCCPPFLSLRPLPASDPPAPPLVQAGAVVFTVAGGADLSLQEVNEVASVINSLVSPDANIIFGTSVDEDMSGEVAVTVVATRFGVVEDTSPSFS